MPSLPYAVSTAVQTTPALSLALETNEQRRSHLTRLIARFVTSIVCACAPIYAAVAIFANQPAFWLCTLLVVQSALLSQLILHTRHIGPTYGIALLMSSWIAIAGIYLIVGTTLPMILCFPTLILMALLLLDTRAAIVTTIITLLFSSALYIAQIILHIYSPPVHLDSFVEQVLVLCIFVFGVGSNAGCAIFLHTDRNRSFGFAQRQAAQLAVVNSNLDQRHSISQDVSQRIVTLTTELSAASAQHTVGAQSQLSEITEMSTALTELAEAATHIAERAQAVDNAATQSRKAAETMRRVTIQAASVGQRSVEAFSEIVDGTGRIEQTYQQLTRTLVGLAENSRQVRNILSLIKGIADETHMLALNAAIEAAGQSGNGARFGVIASQVKALADRSLSATTDVQKIITNIENAIGAAVMVAESGAAEVGQAAMIARVSSGTMIDLAQTIVQAESDASRIVSAIGEVRNLAHEIASATAQQQRVDLQVLNALNDVRQIAEQSATSSRTLQTATNSLTDLSRNLAETLTI